MWELFKRPDKPLNSCAHTPRLISCQKPSAGPSPAFNINTGTWLVLTLSHYLPTNMLGFYPHARLLWHPQQTSLINWIFLWNWGFLSPSRSSSSPHRLPVRDLSAWILSAALQTCHKRGSICHGNEAAPSGECHPLWSVTNRLQIGASAQQILSSCWRTHRRPARIIRKGKLEICFLGARTTFIDSLFWGEMDRGHVV